MNGLRLPEVDIAAGQGAGAVRRPRSVRDVARNTLQNLVRWSLAVAPAPPWRMLRPSPLALAATAATLCIVVALMFALDAAADAWARGEPGWVRGVFEHITRLGLSGWFLIPSAVVVIWLAAVTSPALSRQAQAVLAALAARFGFLFLAVGVPGLFVTVVKGMIGRARPFVGGGQDNPFLYVPFDWRPAYASMPSGHATTVVAAALAIGTIWPRTRVVVWLYAVVIIASRIFVLAHHPSDLVAGALTGAAGVYLVRRWFAARHLVFRSHDLRARPAPSWRRIKATLREVVVAA